MNPRPTELIILTPLTLLAIGYIVGVVTGLILALMNGKRGAHR